jgi:hypothetical protein
MDGVQRERCDATRVIHADKAFFAENRTSADALIDSAQAALT